MVEKVDICDISIKESMKKLVAFNLRIMFVIFYGDEFPGNKSWPYI